jgi:hypothetical protein
MPRPFHERRQLLYRNSYGIVELKSVHIYMYISAPNDCSVLCISQFADIQIFESVFALLHRLFPAANALK